jgi:ATP-dependent Clp protease ATP-binding subunit ClpB
LFENLKRALKPEFLNRIDETIMFTPLTRDNVKAIVKLQFDALVEMLAEREITLSATDDVINRLSELGYDPQFGARPVKRVIQREVLNELSKELLGGKVHKGDEIVLDEFDDKFIFRKPIEV